MIDFHSVDQLGFQRWADFHDFAKFKISTVPGFQGSRNAWKCFGIALGCFLDDPEAINTSLYADIPSGRAADPGAPVPEAFIRFSIGFTEVGHFQTLRKQWFGDP